MSQASIQALIDSQVPIAWQNGLSGVAFQEILTDLNEAIFGPTTNYFFNVQAYGAKGDGSTDDTAAFIAAVAAANAAGGVVTVPNTASGYCLNTGNINLPVNTTISGSDMVLLTSTTTGYIFGVNGDNISISGFSISMTGSGSGSAAIVALTSNGNWNSVRITRMFFTNCVNAITDQTTVSAFIFNWWLTDLYSQLTRGTPYVISRSRGFLYFNGCVADHTLNTLAVTWNGFNFSDFQGLELTRCDVVGPVASRVTPAYQSTAIGFVFLGVTPVPGGSSSIWLDRCLADSSMGDFASVSNCTAFLGFNLESFGNLGSGLTLSNVQDWVMTDTLLYGASGLTAAAAGKHGLAITNSNTAFATISNINIKMWTGDGVNITDASDLMVTGVVSQFNVGWGWFESGAANVNIKVGGNLVENNVGGSGGSLTQVGSLSSFASYLPNDGVFIAVTTGAAVIA